MFWRVKVKRLSLWLPGCKSRSLSATVSLWDALGYIGRHRRLRERPLPSLGSASPIHKLPEAVSSCYARRVGTGSSVFMLFCTHYEIGFGG
jgi:hypothetical protein